MNEGATWFGEFWQWLRSEAGTLALSGAAGGAVRAIRFKENRKQAAASVFVGALCAIYLEPIAEAYLPPQISHPGIGFLIGVAGIALVGFVQDFVQAYRSRVKGDQP